MDEFTLRINRLTERLRRGTTKFDQIEERADLVEERLTSLQQSVETLKRLLEVSLLMMISSEKEKHSWIQFVKNDRQSISNPIIKQFFSRLESSLHRSIVDSDEKQAYLEALSLVQKPSIVSSCVVFK